MLTATSAVPYNQEKGVNVMLEEKDLQACWDDERHEAGDCTGNYTENEYHRRKQGTNTAYLLAEGQKTILETLAPKNRVEELEDEIAFLKSVIKLHGEQIAWIRKAQ